MRIIRVARGSPPGTVAGAIGGMIREGEQVRARAIGAAAVNRAIKAVAIAHSFLARDGMDIVCVPGFTAVDIEGRERTALKLLVEPR